MALLHTGDDLQYTLESTMKFILDIEKPKFSDVLKYNDLTIVIYTEKTKHRSSRNTVELTVTDCYEITHKPSNRVVMIKNHMSDLHDMLIYGLYALYEEVCEFNTKKELKELQYKLQELENSKKDKKKGWFNK